MNKLNELEKKLLETIVSEFQLNQSKICLEFYDYLKILSKKHDLNSIIKYIEENNKYIAFLNQIHNTYSNHLFTAYLALEIAIKKTNT